MIDVIKFLEENKIRVLLLIVFTGLALRIYISFFSDLTWWNTDSYGYYYMADMILYGFPISEFPNGYPLFIAAIKLIVSEQYAPLVNIILNILFGTLSVLLVYLILVRLQVTSYLALLGALIIACFPNQLNYTRQLLSEMPTVILLLTGVWFFVSGKYFLSGITFAVAMLFRSSLVPIILIGIFILFKDGKKQFLYFYSGALAIYVINLILTFSEVIKPSDNLGMNILIATTAENGKVAFDLSRFNQTEKDNPVNTYFSYLINQPGVWLQERWYSLNVMWGWASEGDANNPRSLLSRIILLIKTPFFIVSLIGTIYLILYPETSDWRVWLPAGIIINLTVIHLLLFSTPRFSVPAEPFTIISTVYFFHNRRSYLK